MQIDVVGGFSAACASVVYEGGAWPKEWERGTFVTEPILNVIHHEVAQASGANVHGGRPRSDLFSRDSWFRPIDLEVGPDGAMYVLRFLYGSCRA